MAGNRKERNGLRTKTILVVGGHGYGNAGDEAQCAVTLRLLAERYPGYQIRDLTPNPDFSFGEHPRFAHDYAPRVLLYNPTRRHDWYKLNSRTRKLGFLAVSALLLLNAHLVKRNMKTWFLNARRASFLQQLSQCSLLYFSGGGYLTGATRSRLWEGMVLCRLAKTLGVPVAMSGQTIGVWNGPLERKFAHWGFKDIGVIGLRDDEDSLKALAEIGISGDHVLLTHDDALFCEKAARRQVNGRYIAVNFHFWGMKDRSEKASALESVHLALEKTRKATRIEKVVFLAMHKSDLKSAAEYRLLFPGEVIDVFPAVGRFREIRRAIADAEILLTMKHHPIIFAVGEGTPVVSLAYSPYYVHKNFGAMQQYGVESCSTNLSSPDWPAQFDAALSKALDRDWFAAETMVRRKLLKDRENTFVKRVDALFDRKGSTL